MSAEPRPSFPSSRDYGPRARRLIERAIAERIPLRGSIELTHRCNLACVHCYVNLPAADRAAQKREMTTAEVKRVIDELVDEGLLSLTLTGGEPLLRPDFAEIYRHAHDKGLIVTVYSNATLITDRVVELFRAHPPSAVDVTMYGYTPETYDHVAGAGPGQHARYRRGLDRLLEAGIRLTLKTMALRSNHVEVPAMAGLASALGCEFRLDAILSPRIDGGRGPLRERLTPEEIAAIEMRSDESKSAWDEFCSSRTGAPPDSDALYQCGAGVGSFLIDPYGRLHVCELSRTLGWDVLGRGFRDGWYRAIPDVRAQKRPHDDTCGTCHAHGACSNCQGMSELEAMARAPSGSYFCEVTDERNRRLFGDERPQPNGLVRLRLPRELATQP